MVNEIDIVIPLGYGSLHQNLELGYCLRSIEKYVTGYRNIVIVGETPYWLRNVTLIPTNETGQCTTARIFLKLLTASRSDQVSENFLYCNDDFLFTQQVNAGDIPNYFQHDLEELPGKVRMGRDYQLAVNRTKDALRERDLPILHYDVHMPVLINKNKFQELSSFDWNNAYGYIIKSLYCNLAGVTGEEYADIKINHAVESEEELKQLIYSRFMFSIGDNAINSVFIQWLQKEFPNKSKFEA